MATTNCRWFPVADKDLPLYFVGAGELNKSSVMDAATAMSKGIVSVADIALAAQNVVDEFVRQGEDAADGEANVNQGKTWVGEYQGDTYIFFETAEAGTWVYKRKCGVSAQLPFVIAGAALLGVGGFAWGWSRKKGDKRGVPAYALMGATVGILLGAAGGYGVAKLATSRTTKGYSQLGLIDARRVGLLNVMRRVR